MNKSVYSLVLSDEIVQEIDRMAYETGASRSAMINQILADYVRYTTPEKRMREIFSAVEQQLAHALNNAAHRVLHAHAAAAGNDDRVALLRGPQQRFPQ